MTVGEYIRLKYGVCRSLEERGLCPCRQNNLNPHICANYTPVEADTREELAAIARERYLPLLDDLHQRRGRDRRGQ